MGRGNFNFPLENNDLDRGNLDFLWKNNDLDLGNFNFPWENNDLGRGIQQGGLTATSQHFGFTDLLFYRKLESANSVKPTPPGTKKQRKPE